MKMSVSSEFLKALRGSRRYQLRVDAYEKGKLVASDLPVADGSLSITEGQATRSRLTLTIADPDGRYTPVPGSPLSPFGPELHVQMGVKFGYNLEWVSMGWFPIVSTSSAETWAFYKKRYEDEPVRVNRGAVTTIEAVDRALWVGDYKFLSREQPTTGFALSEFSRILKGVVPWAAFAKANAVQLSDVPIPSGFTYDDDRLGTAVNLAALMNAEFIFNEEGTATLIPREWNSYSVWTIGDGRDPDNAVRVSFDRTMTRDNMYNAVIVRSTNFGGSPIQGIKTETTPPLQWDGPFGRVPYFIDSPALGTQEAVDAAAIQEAANLIKNRLQVMNVECVNNPGIDVGDIVTLPAPRGTIEGRIVSATWPLKGQQMQLQVVVNPFLLSEMGPKIYV